MQAYHDESCILRDECWFQVDLIPILNSHDYWLMYNRTEKCNTKFSQQSTKNVANNVIHAEVNFLWSKFEAENKFRKWKNFFRVSRVVKIVHKMGKIQRVVWWLHKLRQCLYNYFFVSFKLWFYRIMHCT